MVGYAIAALKKENKIIGLRIMLGDDYTYKDLSMSSCLLLKKQSSDSIYNLLNLDKENIKNLPILDIETNTLNKDIYTIILNVNKQYLVSSARGVVFTIDENEVKKLKLSNADEDLSGYFVSIDENLEHYERRLALEAIPMRINDGELSITDEISGDLIIPSIVTSIADNCWLLSGKFETVVLSPKIREIVQGNFNNFNADCLIVPVGVESIKAFGFEGSHINKIIIQGNTLVTIGAFNNSDIKEIYVNNALINKYRQVVNSKIKIKDVKTLS